MKKNILSFLFVIVFAYSSFCQTATTFYVGGDLDKYYPVSFNEPGFYSSRQTTIDIGRSNTHTDGEWRGSLISQFNYHVTNYGHGSKFIDAEIRSSTHFIAGWKDATGFNASNLIIIWFKGGGTTYYLNSAFNITPTVYDNVQHALPFQEENGPACSFKTQLDEYVTNYSSIKELNAYYTGNGFFNGSVGIGTTDPKDYKLAVNGKIRAREIKVENNNWPDYVFTKDYSLPTLQEIEKHIKEKGHLQDIPSAVEVKANGIDLGEMNAKLLQKIEELTLHLIEQDRKLIIMQKEIRDLRNNKN